MQKPANWDAIQAFTGEYETIAPGGYVCVIKDAKVEKTKSEKEVLVLAFDIAEGESKGFYQRKFDEAKKNNADAKWQGTYRQLTEGKSESFFKGVVTAIENSNNFKWDFDEGKLKGKLFGGIFGQEEYMNSKNEVKLSTKCTAIRSVETIKKGVEIPPVKKLKNTSFTSQLGTSPGEYTDELPF